MLDLATVPTDISERAVQQLPLQTLNETQVPTTTTLGIPSTVYTYILFDITLG
jgi:hypothetical protein